MELFGGDEDKCREVERLIAEQMGFDGVVPVSGQTYSRKVDAYFLSALSGIAQSAYKFSNDMRLLQSFEEMEEPFEKNQIGSSAMPYKRNPMRSERISALARYVIIDILNPAITSGTQWFERTLDDSANRRISLPEAFLAIDGILTLYINIVKGGRIYPGMMKHHLDEEMPFMATENIMMYCVRKGKDRQTLHEAIRRHSVDCAHDVKEKGLDNTLLERIAADPEFDITKEEIDLILSSDSFTGAAEVQTEKYLDNFVYPVLEANKDLMGINAEIRV
jgi:adenylosuccinate lyase